MEALPNNQRNAVLKLFLKGRKLSWKTAYEWVGTSGLPKLTHHWEKRGYIFKKENKSFKTKQGSHGCYTEYQLDVKKTPKKLLNVKFAF